MNLPTYQNRIKGLIKSSWSPGPDDSSYFHRLQQSERLAAVIEVAVWWRAFQVEQYCQLTAGYLKREGYFERLVGAFYQRQAVSPFIEQAAGQFLAFVQEEPLPTLFATLAAFEQALIRVRRGEKGQAVLQWAYNPYDVLHYALGGPETPRKASGCSYQVVVSSNIDGYFMVEHEGAGGAKASSL